LFDGIVSVCDVIERSKETCEACRYCWGPIVPICGNPNSEFYEGVVHRQGWCPSWSEEPVSEDT
jgi:hypothetical protein